MVDANQNSNYTRICNVKGDHMSIHTEEVQDAMFMRSLDLLCDSWENDDLTLDDMADQLEAANKMISGETNFKQFLDVTNLHGREKLN